MSRTMVSALLGFGVAIAANLSPLMAGAHDSSIVFMDQGPNWSDGLRAVYYIQDQGSQLIPMAWLKAVKQSNGKPFLDGSMARYGFVPAADPVKAENLPVGFTNAPSPQGPMAGMGCAACHVREITVAEKRYRIDGGPAFLDFQTFAADLDAAVSRVLASEAAFGVFADDVLGPRTKDEGAVERLHAEVELWSVRYHAFISRSLPKNRPWGPTRLDAISLIYNRLAGLDLGPPPTYLIPGNMERGDAPSRYPFLWNSPFQDYSQWAGFAQNGNDFLAMTRNLGQTYGVFGMLHPQPATASATLFKRNLVADNSANFDGLTVSENLLKRIGPPVWPWPVDQALAATGRTVFERPTAEGGCAECHAKARGEPRPQNENTLRTPMVDAGTDRREWQVTFLRKAETRGLAGSIVPQSTTPLQSTDLALNLLKSAVVGAILESKVGTVQEGELVAAHDTLKGRAKTLVADDLKLAYLRLKGAITVRLNTYRGLYPTIKTNAYEAKVLEGVWAAAPYLHNGSVPTLADLLEPATARPRAFEIGPAYDLARIGLAAAQTAPAFTLHATGCDDLTSGDSDCGHEYGTHLKPDEKKALLEYLKTL